MTELQRAYYAIIPANVRYDKALPPNAKLLYGEITALCNERGYCWASNQYFADLYGVSKKSVSSWINLLVSNGYITSQVNYKKGTKEIENRYLSLNTPIEENVNTYRKKGEYPIEEKFNTPIEENVKENNTVPNITSNTTDEYKGEKRKRFTPPTVSEVKAYCSERNNGIDPQAFVDYYEARGWMVGKNKMKDWKAAVRTWESRRKDYSKQSSKPVRTEPRPEWLTTPEDDVGQTQKMLNHMRKADDP